MRTLVHSAGVMGRMLLPRNATVFASRKWRKKVLPILAFFWISVTARFWEGFGARAPASDVAMFLLEFCGGFLPVLGRIFRRFWVCCFWARLFSSPSFSPFPLLSPPFLGLAQVLACLPCSPSAGPDLNEAGPTQHVARCLSLSLSFFLSFSPCPGWLPSPSLLSLPPSLSLLHALQMGNA